MKKIILSYIITLSPYVLLGSETPQPKVSDKLYPLVDRLIIERPSTRDLVIASSIATAKTLCPQFKWEKNRSKAFRFFENISLGIFVNALLQKYVFQDIRQKNPYLFHIYHPHDPTKTSYLLGSKHDYHANKINTVTAQAFNRSQHLVMELDIFDDKDNCALYEKYKNDTNFISLRDLDHAIAMIAKNANKDIVGLETEADRESFNLFVKFLRWVRPLYIMSYDRSVVAKEKLFPSVIAYANNIYYTLIKSLYHQGGKHLHTVLTNKYKYDGVESYVCEHTKSKLRNIFWLSKILDQLKNHDKNFIMVGCGHLVGEFGLVNMLRQHGYNVTPVQNDWFVDAYQTARNFFKTYFRLIPV